MFVASCVHRILLFINSLSLSRFSINPVYDPSVLPMGLFLFCPAKRWSVLSGYTRCYGLTSTFRPSPAVSSSARLSEKWLPCSFINASTWSASSFAKLMPMAFAGICVCVTFKVLLVIFTAAFTPIPYKVFSITAGVFQINLPTFIIASILGRGGRFIIIGLLIRFFGEPIKAMMDKHFNTFIIVLTIIFALSYVLIGYLF